MNELKSAEQTTQQTVENAPEAAPTASLSTGRKVLRLFLVCGVLGVGGYAYLTILGPVDQVRSAKVAQDAGDWSRAEIHWRNYLRQVPEDANARRQLAIVLLEKARQENADATFGNTPEALAALETAARVSESDPELQEMLLIAQLATGKTAAATKTARRLLKIEADAPEQSYEASDEAYQLAVTDALRKKDYASAGTLIQKLLKRQSPAGFMTRLKQLQWALEAAPDEIPAISAEILEQFDEHDLATLDNGEWQGMLRIGQVVCRRDQEAELIRAAATKVLGIWQEFTEANPDIARTRLFPMIDAVVSIAAVANGAAEESGERPWNDAALQICRRALDGKSETPAVYLTVLNQELVSGNVDAALGLARKGLEHKEINSKQNRPIRTRMYLRLVQMLISRREFDEASKVSDLLVKDEESRGWGYLFTWYIEFNEGRWELALDALKKAEQELGNSPSLSVARARTELGLKNWSAAIVPLNKVLKAYDKLSPVERAWAGSLARTSDDIRLMLVRCYLIQGDTVRAREQFDIVAKTDRYADALELWFTYLLSKELDEQTIASLDTAVRKYSDHHGLLRLKIAVLSKQGQAELARKQYHEFVQAHADRIDAQMGYARWLAEKYSAKEGLAWLDQLSSEEGKRPEVKLMRAALLLVDGESKSVLELLTDDDSEGRIKDSAATAILSALAAHRRGRSESNANDGLDFDDSVAGLLDVSAARNAARAVLLESFSRMRSDPEYAKEFEAHLEEWMQQHPNEPMLPLMRAELLARKGKLQEAREEVDRYHALRPSVDGPFIKARLFLAEKNFDAAVVEINKSLQFDRQHAPSHLLLAQVLLAQGKSSQAITAARRAQVLDRETPTSWLVEAEAKRRLNRLAESAEMYRSIVRRWPEMRTGYLALSKVLLESGAYSDALAVLDEAAMKLGVNPENDLIRIEILLKTARKDDAERIASRLVKEWEISIADDADKVEARERQDRRFVYYCRRVGMVFQESGEYESARLWLRHGLTRANDAEQGQLYFELGVVAILAHQEQPSSEYTQRAFDNFSEARQRLPENLAIVNNLAWLLAVEMGRPQDGLALIDEHFAGLAVESLPPEVVSTIVAVYRYSGQRTKARQVLQAALTRHPKNASLQIQLALLYMTDGRDEEADAVMRALAAAGTPKADLERARREVSQIVKNRAEVTPKTP